MGWADLLQKEDETIVYPWTGGRSVRLGDRIWKLDGKLPDEHSWVALSVSARTCKVAVLLADSSPEHLKHVAVGYLVGDRFLLDQVRVSSDPADIVAVSEAVHFIEPGLPRFSRVSVGRMFPGGPLIFKSQEFPLGPEPEVSDAYLNKLSGVDSIKGVPPALDAAFRMETWQRAEVVRLRAEAEKRRKEEEEKRKKEDARRELAERLGSATSRREMAAIDFGEASKAALAIGGAEYLDHRAATRKGEMVVQFRLNKKAFECVCDAKTMQIIDSGICLNSHGGDGFARGTKGDSWLTLESLPGVIAQAERERKLVVFRHVGQQDDREDFNDRDEDEDW